ncbi:hypothetical protein LIA77_00232 [Sarocladium implicatum]|nr:hypothetical protein LIA77_00232 [Sarocladium implicatum]
MFEPSPGSCIQAQTLCSGRQHHTVGSLYTITGIYLLVTNIAPRQIHSHLPSLRQASIASRHGKHPQHAHFHARIWFEARPFPGWHGASTTILQHRLLLSAFQALPTLNAIVQHTRLSNSAHWVIVEIVFQMMTLVTYCTGRMHASRSCRPPVTSQGSSVATAQDQPEKTPVSKNILK